MSTSEKSALHAEIAAIIEDSLVRREIIDPSISVYGFGRRIIWDLEDNGYIIRRITADENTAARP